MSIIAILYIRQQETVLSLKIEGNVDRTARDTNLFAARKYTLQ